VGGFINLWVFQESQFDHCAVSSALSTLLLVSLGVYPLENSTLGSLVHVPGQDVGGGAGCEGMCF
jgi:hypothetical protein